MTISRNTFDSAKNYKRVVFHEDRQLLDSELNEGQDIQDRRIQDIADQLFVEGAILEGLDVTIGGDSNEVLTIAAGKVYLEGHVEAVPEAVLTFDPEKSAGIDTVYLELLKIAVDVEADPTLVNPRTSEPTAEREQWVLELKDSDTSADPLPDGATERRVLPLFQFDRAEVTVTPAVSKNTTARLDGLQDTEVDSPTAGQILRYDDTSSTWKNEAFPDLPDALNDLGDVEIAAPTQGQILQFAEGSNRWENQDAPFIPSNLSDLGNVSATAPSKGHVLAFNGSIWTPSSLPRWIPLTGVTRAGSSQLGNIPSWVKKGWPLRVQDGTTRYYGIYSAWDPTTPAANWLGPTLPAAFQSVEVGTPDMVFEVPLSLDAEVQNAISPGGPIQSIGPFSFGPHAVLAPESYVCGVAYSLLLEYDIDESWVDPFVVNLVLELQSHEGSNSVGTDSCIYYEMVDYIPDSEQVYIGVAELCGLAPLRGISYGQPPSYTPPKNFLLGTGVQGRTITELRMGFEGGYPNTLVGVSKVTSSLYAVRVGEHDPEWELI